MRSPAAKYRFVFALAIGGITPPALGANSGATNKFTLDHVSFVGNSQVSTDTLMGLVGLKPGDKVDHDIIQDAFNRVVAEYQKDDVGGSIDPKMTYPRGRVGHIDLTFVIAELPHVEAKKVPLIIDHETFTGNVKISNAQLMPSLKLRPGDTVTTEQILADRDALAAVYKGANHGVGIAPKVSYPSPGHVDLNFQLDENPPKPKS